MTDDVTRAPSPTTPGEVVRLFRRLQTDVDPDTGEEFTYRIYAVEALGTDHQVHSVVLSTSSSDEEPPERIEQSWRLAERAVEMNMREEGVWLGG